MKPLTIYFDESCGICRKIKSFLMAIDFFNTCRYSYAGNMDFDEAGDPMKNRYFDLYSYDGQDFYAGYETYLQITKRIFMLWPLHLIMRMPFVRPVGEKIYARVARSRTCTL